MSKCIVVCGYGVGISAAVARRFGEAGFSVALVARDGARIAQAARELAATGIDARPFTCDLGDPAGIPAMIHAVQSAFGGATVLHWNAYATGAGDLKSATVSDLRSALDVSVVGLIACIQALLSDLRVRRGCVLVTGGGLSVYDAKTDAYAVSMKSAGLAIAKAAQHKAVGLLRETLAADGIYVGEIIVSNLVKGTAFDRGSATLDPNDIAAEFWHLYDTRPDTPSVTMR